MEKLKPNAVGNYLMNDTSSMLKAYVRPYHELSYWRRQCTFNRPPKPEAPEYNRIGQPRGFSPLGGIHSLPIKSQQIIPSSVIVLLCACCPTHVARIISFVIIKTFKRMKHGWPSAHIRQKKLKTFPTFTYRNAASSIIWVVAYPWIQALFSHCCPRTIFRTFSFAMCGIFLGSGVRSWDSGSGLGWGSGLAMPFLAYHSFLNLDFHPSRMYGRGEGFKN